jgi:hypothetical protein
VALRLRDLVTVQPLVTVVAAAGRCCTAFGSKRQLRECGAMQFIRIAPHSLQRLGRLSVCSGAVRPSLLFDYAQRLYSKTL